MKLPEEARKNLIKSVHLTPLLWASWYELAKLCETRDMVSYLGEIWGYIIIISYVIVQACGYSTPCAIMLASSSIVNFEILHVISVLFIEECT